MTVSLFSWLALLGCVCINTEVFTRAIEKLLSCLLLRPQLKKIRKLDFALKESIVCFERISSFCILSGYTCKDSALHLFFLLR